MAGAKSLFFLNLSAGKDNATPLCSVEAYQDNHSSAVLEKRNPIHCTGPGYGGHAHRIYSSIAFTEMEMARFLYEHFKK